jgi:hypothetical protein
MPTLKHPPRQRHRLVSLPLHEECSSLPTVSRQAPHPWHLLAGAPSIRSPGRAMALTGFPGWAAARIPAPPAVKRRQNEPAGDAQRLVAKATPEGAAYPVPPRGGTSPAGANAPRPQIPQPCTHAVAWSGQPTGRARAPPPQSLAIRAATGRASGRCRRGAPAACFGHGPGAPRPGGSPSEAQTPLFWRGTGSPPVPQRWVCGPPFRWGRSATARPRSAGPLGRRPHPVGRERRAEGRRQHPDRCDPSCDTPRCRRHGGAAQPQGGDPPCKRSFWPVAREVGFSH